MATVKLTGYRLEDGAFINGRFVPRLDALTRVADVVTDATSKPFAAFPGGDRYCFLTVSGGDAVVKVGDVTASTGHPVPNGATFEFILGAGQIVEATDG